MFQYDYERASTTADIVVCNFIEQEYLFIKRKKEPFRDKFAFPGGFVERRENSQQTAVRELMEETNIAIPFDNMYQFGTFDDPNRDPRGWIVSTAYLCIVGKDAVKNAKAGDDADSLHWIKRDDILNSGDDFAFDHYKIWEKADGLIYDKFLRRVIHGVL
jgi:8-oxo-dGTP diphosphatase